MISWLMKTHFIWKRKQGIKQSIDDLVHLPGTVAIMVPLSPSSTLQRASINSSSFPCHVVWKQDDIYSTVDILKPWQQLTGSWMSDLLELVVEVTYPAQKIGHCVDAECSPMFHIRLVPWYRLSTGRYRGLPCDTRDGKFLCRDRRSRLFALRVLKLLNLRE